MILRLTSAVILLCLLAAAPAGAVGKAVDDANEQEKQSAQRAFKDGAAHFQAQRWSEAIDKFRASLDVVASPNTRVMLGRALRKAGRLTDAYDELKLAADDARELAAKHPKYEQAVQTALVELAEIHVELAILNVEVKGGSEPIRLQVGNRSVARAHWKAIPVMPGDVEVVVTSPGRSVTQRVTAVAANDHRVAFDLSEPDRPLSRLAPPMSSQANPEVLPPGPASREVGLDTTSPEPSALLPWAFVATGVGAAGFITFAVAGSMARSSESDLEASCANDVCPARLEETADEGRTQQTIANIGLAVGAIGLGAAVTLFVLDSNRRDSAAARGARVELVANPRSWAVRGEF